MIPAGTTQFSLDPLAGKVARQSEPDEIVQSKVGAARALSIVNGNKHEITSENKGIASLRFKSRRLLTFKFYCHLCSYGKT